MTAKTGDRGIDMLDFFSNNPLIAMMLLCCGWPALWATAAFFVGKCGVPVRIRWLGFKNDVEV